MTTDDADGAEEADGLPAQALKAAARQQARVRRQAVPASVRTGAGAKAAEHFLAAIPLPTGSPNSPDTPGSSGLAVSVYWPLADEFDSRPLLHTLIKAGHRVALPVVIGAGQTLCFRIWQPGDALAKSSFGVLEPLPGAGAVTPEVVVTPFLAYNGQGFRLGYGGGYYDRTLRILRHSVPGLLAVGLGYAAQATAALPYDDNDEPLDWLVNERGAQQFARQPVKG